MADTFSNVTRFPLCWPEGWKVTATRRQSKFKKVNPGGTRDELVHQLRALGATDIIMSTDVATRDDGMPYSDGLDRPIKNPGVALYFKRRGRPQAMAVDVYLTPVENMRALCPCVDALRTMDRHGAVEVLEKVFLGFTGLPPAPKDRTWWDILGVKREAPLDVVKQMWLEGAKRWHPDAAGGDAETMALINRAWEDAQRERGGANG